MFIETFRSKFLGDDSSKERENLVSDEVGKSYSKDHDVQIFDDNSFEESSDAYEGSVLFGCFYILLHLNLVLYCFEEDGIPLTRYEVWLKDNGHPEKMDCFGAFNPSSDFAVFKVIRKRGTFVLIKIILMLLFR